MRLFFNEDFDGAKRTAKKLLCECGRQKWERTIYESASGIQFIKFDGEYKVIRDEYGKHYKPFPFDYIKVI